MKKIFFILACAAGANARRAKYDALNSIVKNYKASFMVGGAFTTITDEVKVTPRLAAETLKVLQTEQKNGQADPHIAKTQISSNMLTADTKKTTMNVAWAGDVF